MKSHDDITLNMRLLDGSSLTPPPRDYLRVVKIKKINLGDVIGEEKRTLQRVFPIVKLVLFKWILFGNGTKTEFKIR